MKRTVLGVVAAAAVLVLACVLFAPGCKPAANTGGGGGAASDNVLWRSELFDYAMDTLLNRLDEYHSVEMRQQTINRLDQWIRKQSPLEGWQPDPAIAGVSEELRAIGKQVVTLAQQVAQLQQSQEEGSIDNLPADLRATGERLARVGSRLSLVDLLQVAAQMSTMAKQLEDIQGQSASSPEQANQAARTILSQLSVEEFGRYGIELLVLARQIDPSILEFPTYESFMFQEAVWLRNVASWASGEDFDDPVKPATALFDWVVRNVQLVRDRQADGNRVLQKPWETLLTGQGTAIDRAWLYVLLARQLNIDAALLGFNGEGEAEDTLTKLWAVGVLIEGEIYLFEPVLGLPIPKLGGWELTDEGLVVHPATLAEAASDKAVLRQMDVLKEGDYSVKAEDLERVVALVDASPSYLSQRMKMVENRLSGDQKIVLTIDATAQMGRFERCDHVVDAKIWPLAYQVLWQGIRLVSERQQWQNAMLEPFGFPEQAPLLWKARTYYFKGQFTGTPSAVESYQQARRSDFDLARAEMDAEREQKWRRIKFDASYWLGLLMAETGNYRSAEDYLKTRVLMTDLGGRWEYGATYNLARVYEVMGDIPTAITLYQAHLDSPQAQGNLIRAGWLRQLIGKAGPEAKVEADGQAEMETPEEDQEVPVAEPVSDDEAEAEKKSTEPNAEDAAVSADADDGKAGPEEGENSSEDSAEEMGGAQSATPAEEPGVETSDTPAAPQEGSEAEPEPSE